MSSFHRAPDRKGMRPQAIRIWPNGRVSVLQWMPIEKPGKAEPERDEPAGRGLVQRELEL